MTSANARLLVSFSIVATSVLLTRADSTIYSSISSNMTEGSDEYCTGGPDPGATVTWTQNWAVNCNFECPGNNAPHGSCGQTTATVSAQGGCGDGNPQLACYPVIGGPNNDEVIGLNRTGFTRGRVS
jgi:hypothetical protein